QRYQHTPSIPRYCIRLSAARHCRYRCFRSPTSSDEGEILALAGLLEKSIVNRVLDIQKLKENDKQHVFALLDAFIKQTKLQSICDKRPPGRGSLMLYILILL